ncbi:hypothetical protein M408DRAFT_231896, partial [Serendipita vermifera MAFF 305830]
MNQPGTLDLTSVRDALPAGNELAQGRQTNQRPMPDSSDSDIEMNLITEGGPADAQSIQYLRSRYRKSIAHPYARRVPVTNVWLSTKSNQISRQQRDRLRAGCPVEDALPDYDCEDDDDGYLQTTKFKKGSYLAFQSCVRRHIQFLRTQNSSMIAFPEGCLSTERRQRFLNNQYHATTPDRGSTAEECCPDVEGTACNRWNLTFITSVARDFVSKVAEGWYAEDDLPPEAMVQGAVERRVKTCVESMIKTARRTKRLRSNDAIAHAKAHNKYMQRRREKHSRRLVACDQSPKYQKYFGLLKAVGPEGNSDEETDNEAQQKPAPLKVFPLRWRSRKYEALVHSIDTEGQNQKSNPLLHAGPVRRSSRSSLASR